MKIRRSVGIRFKLITIFVLIKVLPLMALSWIAWTGIMELGESLREKIDHLSAQTQGVIGQVSDLAVASSIRALDIKSRDNIERLTTDTARAVAAFLYARDNDIRVAANLPARADEYRRFLAPNLRKVIMHRPWVMNEAGDAWVPAEGPRENSPAVTAENEDNAKDFHYRPPEDHGISVQRPLYLEMTFVDLNGNEKIKVTTSDLLPPEKKNISDPANTYCKAERYFDELKRLKPGEIYVSEVIGPHLKSPVIGAYTRRRAEERGIPFKPEEAAYAGKENPVGKRFRGLIRWATPVVRNGKVTGWVTLALDHTHVMEFSDHLVPTEERYSPISDAGSGNYAFIWDYKDRNISHPRDYFIAGYDPETGQRATPWLEELMFEDLRESGLSFEEWVKGAPVMQEQTLKKKPSRELTRQGMLGLDCRYLNFAPQCQGWYNLTKDGGSGSFVIFWSGLWKLTTAAAIPYFTGRYGSTPRGFGFVTIGANVREFHKAASETGDKIGSMASTYEKEMAVQNEAAQTNLKRSLRLTAEQISYSTLAMIAIVILIAIWMASTLTRKITSMIEGIRRFKSGDMEQRLAVTSNDEIGQLAQTFNEMSDNIQKLVEDLRQAETKYRGFFENSTEGIYRSRANGEIVNVNPAFVRLFGFSSKEEMMSSVRHIGEDLYVDPRRREELVELLHREGKVRNFEYDVRRRDGEVRTLQTSCYWVEDTDGQWYMEGMSTDVTERKMALEALKDAKDKAEQLSQMKSNFLSMVSHELRTPLTAIIGFTKLTRKNLSDLIGKASREEMPDKLLKRMKENTSVIISEGDRLTELINNVLDLAKLEAGYFEWHFATISLREVLERSIASTTVLFDGKNVAFESEIDPDVPEIVGDFDRLVQVCINLIANAAKFTEQGRVVCKAHVEGDNVVVRVCDTGSGVSMEDAEAIFDKFRQLGDTLTDKPKGTGLGLPISREIVEHHGGRIWCEPNPGGGSVFAFCIPLNWKSGK
ncbi:HAMP domain-containing protein [Pseudodesulfovibrio cashew]|uniref:histidine kinase n=1 Tax=Pseudodesulfovibrio cashew TaxID=2678688 RepID=A0A6I6JFD9_9BACT|nr:ATP-binding protein [Pseudodesulfovibrio cashew]QGY41545.1 HAMP domain-containing protein [Pseudodesulfovibrio cashew]